MCRRRPFYRSRCLAGCAVRCRRCPSLRSRRRPVRIRRSGRSQPESAAMSAGRPWPGRLVELSDAQPAHLRWTTICTPRLRPPAHHPADRAANAQTQFSPSNCASAQRRWPIRFALEHMDVSRRRNCRPAPHRTWRDRLLDWRRRGADATARRIPAGRSPVTCQLVRNALTKADRRRTPSANCSGTVGTGDADDTDNGSH